MTRSQIQLVLADVDGTLVTQEKGLSVATRAAVQSLATARIAFSIMSSRPAQGLRMLIEPLELRIPFVGLNGGIVVSTDLSVLERHTLDPSTSRTAVTLLEEAGLDVWVYTEFDWLVRDAAGPHVAREAWILQFSPKVVAGFSDAQLAFAIKIVGVSDNLDLVAACEGGARLALGPKASVARSEVFNLDITSPAANKGAGLLTLARMVDVSPANIATLGDMPNDVSMFAVCGLSIAMGNASDAVRAKADEVTLTNQDDGFAAAVRNFILPLAPKGRNALGSKAGRGRL